MVPARTPWESSLLLQPLESRILLAAEALNLGNGLAANYFSDGSFNNLSATRLDSQVSFNWGSAAPLANLPADGFAVRWSGKVQAQSSQNYTFYTTSAADDGVRLTIYTADLSVPGGRKANKLIDTWSSHTAAEQSGSIALTAGETYDLVLEYTNSSGSANVALSWSTPAIAKAAIPASQLFPTQSLAVSSISDNWLSADIGAPATAGAFVSQGSSYALSGSGIGIGGTSDQFQYASKVLQGDGIAIAKIEAMNGLNVGPGAAIGLVVRDGTSAGAAYAGVFLTPTGGASFGYRTTSGSAATSLAGPAVAAPYWLKLVRRGSTVNGYVSPTGNENSWTLVGRADIKAFDDAVLLGLAATSGAASSTLGAHLTNLKLSADVPMDGAFGHLTTYYQNFPYIDLIKGGAGPALHVDTATGNVTNTNATLDANGWPTEDFGYRGPYVLRPDAIVGRDFTLTFNGKATVTIFTPGFGTAVPASAATGDPNYTAGYDSANNASKWYLRAADAGLGNYTGVSPRFQNTQRTATSPTGTGVTNIKLLQPGYTSYDNQHVFAQEWLDFIKQSREFRVKDWANVDQSTQSDWSARPLPSTPNQIGVAGFGDSVGAAWEYLVQIANLTHRDLWISLPAHLDNPYILKLAQLIRYGSDGRDPYTSPQANPAYPGLDPDLNLYVEYSNEVWNYTFESNAYAQSQAWAAYQAGTKYGPNQVPLNYDGRTWTSSGNQDLINRWLAAHLKQDIIDQFAQVFGADAITTRIRPVLSGWMIYPDTTVEEGLKFLSAAGWTPKDSLYGTSMAAYYGYNDLAAAQFSTNSARDSATKEDTLDLFENAATAKRGSLMWPINSALAAAYGLKAVAYEGGPSLGSTNAQGSAQLDPSFASMQTAIINSWFAAGATQYNYSFLEFLPYYGQSVGDFFFSDNRWDMNQPRSQSYYDLATAGSTPPVIDGFTALPTGELEARNYVNNPTPDPLYLVAPQNWEQSHTYRYMVRSLVNQDLDLRLSVAATAAGQRIVLRVNGTTAQTYDYAAASSRDPANNYLYSDTAPLTIHLKAGINLIDLVMTNTVNPTNAKAEVNSLKFTPVGGALANTLPWVYGLPGNLANPGAGQTVTENGTTNYPVDIQDLETPALAGQASPFTITAVSDNPTLLPNDSAHIVWSYSTNQARYTLSLIPAANRTGKTNIAVTITDPSGGVRNFTIPITVVPAAATSVTATAAADGTVSLNWTNNSRVNPTFKIERSLSSTGNGWVQVGTTGATAYGSAAWSEKPPGGASYYYRISAIDPSGLTGNAVAANSNAAVAVPTASSIGAGLAATNLLTGKTYFASSTDTTPNGGGQSINAAFDGTSQFFAFNAVSGNSLAVTGLSGLNAIDTLKVYFPGNVFNGRMPAVSIYYSANDYTSGGQAAALNASNYTRVGSTSYALYQASVSPVLTQPDGVQVSTLSNLAIPAGTKSLLLQFDASGANPQFAEIQAFSATGAAAPTSLGYTTTWAQLTPTTFANYVGATVSLSWTNPNSLSAATSFVIQRDTSSAFNTANLRTWNAPLNSTSFFNDRDEQNKTLNPYAPTWDTTNRNTPLPAGATYYYRVGTRQADGSVVYAAPLTVTTASASYATDTPTGLTATAASANQINLSWNAVAGATGYKIEKSPRNDFRDSNYAMALVTGTSYSDPTSTTNMVWYYRVRAVGPGGDSNWATATATAQAIPAAPTGLSATTDAGTIHLAWSRPTGKIYAYEIYRGTSAGSLAPYKTFAIGSSAVILPQFDDTGLPDNTTYYYAVRGALWSNNTTPSQLQYTALSSPLAVTTPAPDRTPPKVNRVLVRGGAWTTTFLDDLDSRGLGLPSVAPRLGFALGSSSQPLGWRNIDTIAVAFSENVSVGKNYLSLAGINIPSYLLDSATFSYDPQTFVATWVLSQPLAVDRLNFNLPTGLSDAWFNALDGDGNGAGGDAYNGAAAVLPGDSNADGKVDFADLVKVSQNYKSTGAMPATGDFNGDGKVDFADLVTVSQNYKKSLPAAPASMMSMQTAPAVLVSDTATAALAEAASSSTPSSETVSTGSTNTAISPASGSSLATSSAQQSSTTSTDSPTTASAPDSSTISGSPTTVVSTSAAADPVAAPSMAIESSTQVVETASATTAPATLSFAATQEIAAPATMSVTNAPADAVTAASDSPATLTTELSQESVQSTLASIAAALAKTLPAPGTTQTVVAQPTQVQVAPQVISIGFASATPSLISNSPTLATQPATILLAQRSKPPQLTKTPPAAPPKPKQPVVVIKSPLPKFSAKPIVKTTLKKPVSAKAASSKVSKSVVTSRRSTPLPPALAPSITLFATKPAHRLDEPWA